MDWRRSRNWTSKIYLAIGNITALSELNDIRENIFRDEETRHFLSWNCVVTLSTAEHFVTICVSQKGNDVREKYLTYVIQL
jgi:hypothetical protein